MCPAGPIRDVDRRDVSFRADRLGEHRSDAAGQSPGLERHYPV